MSPTLQHGETTLINIRKQGWTGALQGVFIIKLNNTIMVKRLQYDPIKNGYHISSDNPVYRSYFLTQHESQEMFTAIAKIISVVSKVN
ncbi:S24 family peptidase [Zophobihabitans entericus]|uniref:Helix-turn-helix transcriptional regulator n=1 Tax=Zophobihabitans entericus TaxID=1635327 RepID=A0A6G9I9M6_9GAMM|nr:helix-turn-helix transcriptional regulator [Zophobihabitans entericus]